MMELANIFGLLQDGSQAAPGFMEHVGAFLSSIGLGAGELSVGGVAVLLALVWVFVRIVRMVVGILLGICLLLLVLQLLGVVDAVAVWESLAAWLFPAEA